MKRGCQECLTIIRVVYRKWNLTMLFIMTRLTWERNHMSATNVTRHSLKKLFLINHDKTHMGEKPNECYKCDKTQWREVAKNGLITIGIVKQEMNSLITIGIVKQEMELFNNFNNMTIPIFVFSHWKGPRAETVFENHKIFIIICANKSFKSSKLPNHD